MDYVMGLILIGVGLAVPDLPTAIAVALVFGTAVNPFLFVPLAFDPDAEGGSGAARSRSSPSLASAAALSQRRWSDRARSSTVSYPPVSRG
jgi:hypothetical protein